MYTPELAANGGMAARVIELSTGASYDYTGNYVLVLDGSCNVQGQTREAALLVVTNEIAAQPFALAANGSGKCLLLAVSFKK